MGEREGGTQGGPYCAALTSVGHFLTRSGISRQAQYSSSARKGHLASVYREPMMQ